MFLIIRVALLLYSYWLPLFQIVNDNYACFISAQSVITLWQRFYTGENIRTFRLVKCKTFPARLYIKLPVNLVQYY